MFASCKFEGKVGCLQIFIYVNFDGLYVGFEFGSELRSSDLNAHVRTSEPD
jgi:hypothetical protein